MAPFAHRRARRHPSSKVFQATPETPTSVIEDRYDATVELCDDRVRELIPEISSTRFLKEIDTSLLSPYFEPTDLVSRFSINYLKFSIHGQKLRSSDLDFDSGQFYVNCISFLVSVRGLDRSLDICKSICEIGSPLYRFTFLYPFRERERERVF